MQRVNIRKSGIYFSFWDQSQENWLDKKIEDASLPITWYLSYPIQFDEPLTVRDIITLLEPFAEVLNVAMIHDLSAVNINQIFDLNKQIKNTPSQIEPNSVYLVRIAEVIPTVESDESFNFLNSYAVLVGIKEIDETGENDEVFSLSSIDFLDWCDLPFEIDDYVEYMNPVTEEVLFEGVINWTLGELIGTILSQVSVTMQIMQNSVISSNESGPVKIKSVFDWLEDLDRILLK
jgi:hypothetical protein